jgi:hypothetical protein
VVASAKTRGKNRSTAEAKARKILAELKNQGRQAAVRSESGKAGKLCRARIQSETKTARNAEYLPYSEVGMSGTGIQQVRQFVASALGGGPLSEALLLQDLRYVGRKFTSAHGTAIWWAEKNLIEVLASDGRLIHSSVIESQSQPAKQAA